MTPPTIEPLAIEKPFENPSSWSQWDANCKYRALHFKFKEQLEWLKDFYPEKLDRLIKIRDDIINEHREVTFKENHLLRLQEKIDRITDKYNCVKKELSGRKLGHFPNRPEHGTTYYIDFNAGNDGNTGLNTGQAWLTLEKYTSVTARTAGDEAKIRANTTELAAVVTDFDEDGDPDDYIIITGCSSTDDPWSDGSDVKPIRNYNGGGNTYWRLLTDHYWKTDRMEIVNGNRGNATLYVESSYSAYFKDCVIRDTAADTGLFCSDYPDATFEGCEFYNNLGNNAQLGNYSNVKFLSCVFNGGGSTTDYGIYAIRNSYFEAIDCSFGQTTSHDTEDIYVAIGAKGKIRNCALDKAVNVNGFSSYILSEDDDATYGAGLLTFYNGTIEKTTGTKTGSASFSLEYTPNAFCGVNNPLTPNARSIIEYPFIIQCTSGVSKTVTVQIRAKGTWGTYPVASELFLEFWYLDHAVNATRTKVVSTDVLSHASDWVSFTVTFTPLQDGLAYGTVKLGIFEDAGDGCYVNGEAT